jgi:hypothetical protein
MVGELKEGDGEMVGWGDDSAEAEATFFVATGGECVVGEWTTRTRTKRRRWYSGEMGWAFGCRTSMVRDGIL